MASQVGDYTNELVTNTGVVTTPRDFIKQYFGWASSPGPLKEASSGSVSSAQSCVF